MATEKRELTGEIIASEEDDTINVVSVDDGATLSGILWGMDTVGQHMVRVTVEVIDA